MILKNKQSFIIRPNISIVDYATEVLHKEGYKLIASCSEDDIRRFSYIQNKEKGGFEIKILSTNRTSSGSALLHIWARRGSKTAPKAMLGHRKNFF